MMRDAHLDKRDVKPRAATEVDKAVGARLKLRRCLLKWSQAELGRRCHVSSQQIHKYEQGISGMRASRLAQFADVLGVPVSFFFEGIEDIAGMPNDMIQFFADPDCIEILMAVREVNNPAFREKLVQLIRVFADGQESLDSIEELEPTPLRRLGA